MKAERFEVVEILGKNQPAVIHAQRLGDLVRYFLVDRVTVGEGVEPAGGFVEQDGMLVQRFKQQFAGETVRA